MIWFAYAYHPKYVTMHSLYIAGWNAWWCTIQ